jgi:hypothetical protein
VEGVRGPFALATALPVRRLELRAGKFSMPDFFDVNDVGSDTHMQFLNWTVDNNGAYDYAADTRGYTYGVVVAYYDRSWAFRFGEALMPKTANGIDLIWNLRRARAENFELELHPALWADRATSIKLLSYVNHANMGIYQDAVDNFLAGKTPVPDITAHPLQTKVKYGVGVNLQQEFGHHVRGFARWGWNEGQHESFAYTEVDETVLLGGLGGRPLAAKTGQNWHGVCFERNFRGASEIFGAWRTWISFRRRRAELRARDNFRGLLQRACVARIVCGAGCAAHQ